MRGVWGRGLPCVPRLFAQQQASPSLGGTVETTSSWISACCGQAGQRDPADRVISSLLHLSSPTGVGGCTSFLWERQQPWCAGKTRFLW